MTTCRSPAGPWSAPAVGDLDVDGGVDGAFVAHGVGTCGGEAKPSCQLVWLDISLSGADAIYRRQQGEVLLSIADVTRLEQRVGGARADDLANDLADLPTGTSSSWRGQIAHGRYEVTLTGTWGRRAWSVQLLGGRLHVVRR